MLSVVSDMSVFVTQPANKTPVNAACEWCDNKFLHL